MIQVVLNEAMDDVYSDFFLTDVERSQRAYDSLADTWEAGLRKIHLLQKIDRYVPVSPYPQYKYTLLCRMIEKRLERGDLEGFDPIRFLTGMSTSST